MEKAHGTPPTLMYYNRVSNEAMQPQDYTLLKMEVQRMYGKQMHECFLTINMVHMKLTRPRFSLSRIGFGCGILRIVEDFGEAKFYS